MKILLIKSKNHHLEIIIKEILIRDHLEIKKEVISVKRKLKSELRYINFILDTLYLVPVLWCGVKLHLYKTGSLIHLFLLSIEILALRQY